jgi:presenilin 1
LIAVLCPYGPLKMLIESSKRQNQEIPALLYSVAIWMMANVHSSTNASDIDDVAIRFSSDSQSRLITRDIQALNNQGDESNSADAENIEMHSFIPNTETEATPTEPMRQSGLKLGLGDFVFYSVLVGRASLFDWITTITCTIAVLSGLVFTIILLAMTRRALPALPISIAFGILFYMVSAIVLVPFINSLTPLASKVAVTNLNGLWVGKTGATTYFI